MNPADRSTESKRTELPKLCERLEIAVSNYGRSAIGLQANEKAHQAWYAAAVIQEFGMARVYREVHLEKKSLYEAAGMDAAYDGGNEVLPDLAVSWSPGIDARHSATRGGHWQASEMLRQLAIVTEFKATGSTKTPTRPSHLRADLLKLAVIARAAAAQGQVCATYLVVLDNHPGKETPSDERSPRWWDEMEPDLMALSEDSRPKLLLITPDRHRRARTLLFGSFGEPPLEA